MKKCANVMHPLENANSPLVQKMPEDNNVI